MDAMAFPVRFEGGVSLPVSENLRNLSETLEVATMEGSRDSNHSFHSSDDFEDDSGLELSLGLSCGGARTKWKGTEGSKNTTAIDAASELGVGGEGACGKAKNGRVSGLDAALKRFLQGRLEDQEESGRLLDGYTQQQPPWDVSGGIAKDQDGLSRQPSLSNMRALMAHGGQGFQEKSGQQELQPALEGKGNPSIFKELQLAPGMAAAWGQLSQQGMPLHLMDPFKSGSSTAGSAAGSTPLLPHFVESMGQKSHSGVSDISQEGRLGEADKGEQQRQAMVQQHDIEQQIKFQEARKKRKYLIEEQKQQKKAKKEDDRVGPHGFRRPGSNTWVRGLEAPTPPTLDGERSLLALPEGEDGEQLQEIRRALQRERDRAVKERGFETEQDESTGAPGDDSRGVEVSFMQRLKAQDGGKFSPSSAAVNGEVNGVHGDAWRQRLMEMQVATANYQTAMADNHQENGLKNMSGLLGSQQAGELSNHSGQRVGSPSRRASGKISCQSSSTGTESSEKKEEQSCGRSSTGDGEASSAPPASTGTEFTSAPTSASFLAPVAIGSTALPYPLPSFSVVPMPYSLPVPVPSAPGVPFPMGFSFPYLMQFVPPTPDAQEPSSARPVNTNAYQLPPGHGYPPLQMPSLETAASWVPVLRPPTAPTFCTPTSGVSLSRTTSGAIEDDGKRSQGGKVHENGSHSPTAATDTSANGNHSLYRAASLNCAQDPPAAFAQLQQAADLQLLSSLPVPAVPQFGPLRTLSDPGEIRSFKEQGGINAFPGFAASVQAAQGLPAAARPASNSSDEGGGRQEQPRFAAKQEAVPSPQGGRGEDPSNSDAHLYGQEDFGRVLGGPFHKGSTDNIPPVSDGLAQELINLKPGIPAGLKFGGTGSSPDLPWVSTTGPGPNGKTICGVLYRFSRSQVKIVCACHGRHMSPSEFVQHAGGVDLSNPEKNIVVNPFPLTSQAASAQG